MGGESVLRAQVDALLLALGTLHGICADRWPGHRLMLPLGGGRDGIRMVAEAEYRRLLAVSGIVDAAPLPWFPMAPDWFDDADDWDAGFESPADSEWLASTCKGAAEWLASNVVRVKFPSGE